MKGKIKSKEKNENILNKKNESKQFTGKKIKINFN